METSCASDRKNPATLNIDTISILDATIERVFTSGNSRYITISYVFINEYSMVYKNYITLVVGPDTLILNPFGESFPFNSLRPKLFVDADFSRTMTFSIPPQARAFKIIVNYKNWPFNSRFFTLLDVDYNNRLIYTGMADDIYSQIKFTINDSTQILDNTAKIIKLEDLNPGEAVKIDYATFMTSSIPPQTTAFRIQTV
ncbi:MULTISPECIES: hypothetical protein [Clostridium]|jgi:hypothetical protein|uniref:Uncharacterized protein n=2 Tax=Clostridium TaxID=1485 RepID=A0A151ANF0_9CLOT|nr:MULTISPECIES: hypothetical protein [Clostridium]KYH29148.1 hypothetical protein CLCOL_12850 [Clostridium colicanis DSM 13634]MBE6043742.1 hypothetical protein [Clostridium thermopalmarium]PRR73789.1 hypothetical protein CPAL_11590 [Clostridium thermopalmarium DSM 5974]PVZ21168.1 hypothetical protein LX19_02306 [Clostridium thermopalmarium DSM 5974]